MRELVHEFQVELAGSGDHDGGSGDLRDPYNDPAVGAALRGHDFPRLLGSSFTAVRSVGMLAESARPSLADTDSR